MNELTHHDEEAIKPVSEAGDTKVGDNTGSAEVEKAKLKARIEAVRQRLMMDGEPSSSFDALREVEAGVDSGADPKIVLESIKKLEGGSFEGNPAIVKDMSKTVEVVTFVERVKEMAKGGKISAENYDTVLDILNEVKRGDTTVVAAEKRIKDLGGN